MKLPRLATPVSVSLCVLATSCLVGAAQAELREFKNTAGVVIKAQLKKAKGPMIYLTNEVGKETSVALTAFSKEDQDYILKWISEDPLAIDYNFVCKADLKQLPGKTANNAYFERVASVQKNYEVDVMNSCRNSLDDLSIDWCAFMLNKVSLSSLGGSSYSFSSSSANPQGELRVKRGSEFVSKLEPSRSTRFTTPAFTLESVIDKYYTGQKSQDRLQGVWLRFYRGDVMVGEWKSPEAPRTEWPGGAHKSTKKVEIAKTDGEKKNQTSTKTNTTKDGTASMKDDDVGDIVKIFQLDDKK